MKNYTFINRICQSAMLGLICIVVAICSFFTGYRTRTLKVTTPIENAPIIVAVYNHQSDYVKGNVNDLANFRKAQASNRAVNSKASI